MAGEVSMEVVNTLGQKVFSSHEKAATADFSIGVHSDKEQIDLSNIAHGVYFITIKTGDDFLNEENCNHRVGPKRKSVLSLCNPAVLLNCSLHY